MPYSLSRPSFAPALSAAPRLHAREHAAELIGRYPNLSDADLQHLVGLFPRLSALDLAQMMSDDDLNPKLEAFCAVHRDLLSPSLSDYTVIAAIMAFPVVVFLAVVLAGQA